MNSRLHNVFNKAETERKDIIKLVSSLPERKLSSHPENRWSISQILTHLITSEKMSLQYMKKKSLGVDKLRNSGPLEEAKILLLQLSQRLPLKYKAPKMLQENTPEALPLSQIQNQWEESRLELLSFLCSIDPKHTKKKIYKHPVAGRLNVIQAVTFFREHVNHHLPQIKRLLK